MSEQALDERMGAFDAVMWGVESDPLLRSVIIAMIVLDADPDMEVVRDRAERMSLHVQKLRQRVVGNPVSVLPPRWEVDPNFDLDYHVREYNGIADGTIDSALRVAERMAEQDFDRFRPAWEVGIVHGLSDNKAAAIIKIHHAITDGVGGMAMAAFLFDLTREPRTDLGPKPDAPEVDVLDPFGRLVAGLGYESKNLVERGKEYGGALLGVATHAVTAPAEFAGEATAFAASVGRLLAPANEPLSPLMRDRSLSVKFAYLERPLAPLKEAGKRNGGTLNDAYMAAVSGGLQRYHLRHDMSVPALRVNMPVNLHTEGDRGAQGGNAWVPARFPVPTDIGDPVERIKMLHPLLLQARTEPAHVLTTPVMRILTRLPGPLTTAVGGGMMKGTDFAATNVPGPPIKIYMAGALIEEILVFAPKGGAAVNIAFFTYDNRAIVGINMDTRSIPDTDAFMECMNEAFDEIAALGS